MATDIHVIMLALEGVEERDHQLFTNIFAANGLKLPPLPRARTEQRASPEAIKAWKDSVNARIRSRKLATPGGRADKLKRPGGGAPARKSKRASKTAR
jgi:hypothetical protein